MVVSILILGAGFGMLHIRAVHGVPSLLWVAFVVIATEKATDLEGLRLLTDGIEHVHTTTLEDAKKLPRFDAGFGVEVADQISSRAYALLPDLAARGTQLVDAGFVGVVCIAGQVHVKLGVFHIEFLKRAANFFRYFLGCSVTFVAKFLRYLQIALLGVFYVLF